jgi:transcriptional regulator with XRE-family HTH domain
LIDFEWLQRKLVETLCARVDRGEWTERGMARACGMSQPHLHNVLKGLRYFSIEMADRVMRALKISVVDLYSTEISPANPGIRLVPLLAPEVGPQCRSIPDHRGDYFAVADVVLLEIEALFAVRCGEDPEMSCIFRPGDILLLDRSLDARDHLHAGSAYLVHTQSAYMVRYVRAGGRRLLFANEATAGDPRLWDEADLAGLALRDIVQARVVALNRSLHVINRQR